MDAIEGTLVEWGFTLHRIFGGYGVEEEVYILQDNRWALNEMFLHYYPDQNSFAIRRNRSKGLAGVKQENKYRVDPETGKERLIETSEWVITFIPKPIRSIKDLRSFLEGVL